MHLYGTELWRLIMLMIFHKTHDITGLMSSDLRCIIVLSLGLIMELFINQEEYIANLAPEAGARIIVHKKGTIPFPEDEGISVIPGRSSSIGMKQVVFIHLFNNLLEYAA